MSSLVTHHAFGPHHDAGLDHPHEWARDAVGHRHAARGQGPFVSDAAIVPTPSSAVHDDAIYAAG